MPALARGARVPPTSNLKPTSSGMPFGVSGTSQLARARPGAASHAETAKESAPAVLSQVLAASIRLRVILCPPNPLLASWSHASIRRCAFASFDGGGLVFALHLLRTVETVRTLELDCLEVESGHGALDRLGLVEKGRDGALDHGVAGLVPLADHLVVGFSRERAQVERVHRLHGGAELRPHFGIDLGRLGADEVGDARARNERSIDAAIGAEIDIANAERVEEMGGMGVVGEAIVLLFWIVDHEPELHALAGKLAVREAAEPGHDRSKP